MVVNFLTGSENAVKDAEGGDRPTEGFKESHVAMESTPRTLPVKRVTADT